MAESVDALVSNTSGREAVPVRPRLRVLKRLCKLLIFKHYTKSSFLYPSDLVTFWSLFSLSHRTDALGLFVLYQYDAA